VTISDEDAKLVTLARGARLRAYAPHTGNSAGAAVRDVDGRTYAAATVENADPALTTSALRAAVVAAAASGARAFEAAVVVSDGDPTPEDLAVLREFGDVPLLVAGPDGVVR
jgi:cytidine deaminase